MIYACQKCGKNFRDNYNLLKHLNRKNSCGKKHKLECDKCGRKFARRACLNYHIEHNVCNGTKNRSDIEIDDDSRDGIKPQSVIEIDSNNDESKITHNIKQSKYICEYCHQTFKTIENIDDHKLYCKVLHNCKTVIRDKYSQFNYVYILQEREFVKSGEKIYKIGKSERPFSARVKQYPKNSILLGCLTCDDCGKCEKEMKKMFAIKYIQRKDIGLEYFEGNPTKMIRDMCDIAGMVK